MENKLKRKKHKYKNEECYICEKHKYITELHHVISFSDCKLEYEIYGEYKTKLVWLCPNCHSYLHKYLKNWNIFDEEKMLSMQNFTEKEFKKITKLIMEATVQ